MKNLMNKYYITINKLIMGKYQKTSVVINEDIREKLEYLNSKGVNISYEFRELIKRLYDKKIKEDDKNM